jgi:GTP cyclohydrolase I
MPKAQKPKIPGVDFRRLPVLEKLYAQFMTELGIDLKDPNCSDTPKRVSKMFLEEFTPALFSQPEGIVTAFPNEKNVYDQYLAVGNIPFYSICAHHHVTFFGTANIVYHPKDKLLGLSKFSRIVNHYCKKPQIQENLTAEILDAVVRATDPHGVYVNLVGRHFCMESRGVRSHGAHTVTSKIYGEIDKNEAIKLLREYQR